MVVWGLCRVVKSLHTLAAAWLLLMCLHGCEGAVWGCKVSTPPHSCMVVLDVLHGCEGAVWGFKVSTPPHSCMVVVDVLHGCEGAVQGCKVLYTPSQLHGRS